MSSLRYSVGMKTLNVSEPLFGTSASLFIECTQDELADALERDGQYRAAIDVRDDDRKKRALASTWLSESMSGNPFSFIWLPHYGNQTEMIGNLVHECVHLSSDICGTLGIEIEEGKANETHAYITEYYFVEFLKQLQGQ